MSDPLMGSHQATIDGFNIHFENRIIIFYCKMKSDYKNLQVIMGQEAGT